MLLQGINPEQARAVSQDPRAGASLLVLAGAGSGKTTVLTRRLAYLVGSGVPSSHILALTFTRDAAFEMKERAARLLVSAGLPPALPAITTFHGFALQVLRSGARGACLPPHRLAGFAKPPELLPEGLRGEWARREAERLRWRAPEEALKEALQGAFAEGVEVPRSEADPAAKFRAAYRRHLLENDRLAFEDMVPLLLHLLKTEPPLLSELRREKTFFLVDEFQDTSPDQLELLRLLAADRPVFLVGDDDQAIYGFRGADPGVMEKALSLFPGLEVLKLTVNYRSTENIVRQANGIVKGKKGPLRKSLLPAYDRKDPLFLRNARIVRRESAEDRLESLWMAREMKRLHREAGLDFAEMAVLFRLHALEEAYAATLRRELGEAASRIAFKTIHAAKGLEYGAVFLVGLEDGILPYRRSGTRADPAEERRLFYVGVTRARFFLYLCHCRRRSLLGKAREYEPSPFLRIPLARSRPPGWLSRAVSFLQPRGSR